MFVVTSCRAHHLAQLVFNISCLNPSPVVPLYSATFLLPASDHDSLKLKAQSESKDDNSQLKAATSNSLKRNMKLALKPTRYCILLVVYGDFARTHTHTHCGTHVKCVGMA